MYELIIYSEMLENINVAGELLDEAIKIDVEENGEEANLCDILSPAFESINYCVKILESKRKRLEEDYVAKSIL